MEEVNYNVNETKGGSYSGIDESILDLGEKKEKPQSLTCIKICLTLLCLGTLAGIITLGVVLSST
jgi:hypothetical protein